MKERKRTKERKMTKERKNEREERGREKEKQKKKYPYKRKNMKSFIERILNLDVQTGSGSDLFKIRIRI